MPGFKHLIECHCVLALYRNLEKIVYHKFPVYSKVDNKGRIVEKIVKCNNCETVHIVKEACKSEIKPGKDQTNIVLTKDDIKYSLTTKMSDFLEKIDADLATWEHILDIIEEKRWGEEVVVKRDIVDSVEHVKLMSITGEDRFKVFPGVIKDMITSEVK